MNTDVPTLDAQACYPALLARDARFDGRFFVGVTSTGVYCRPICRVRTPKLANCRFFGSAALAEAARFRPCMKCRPELAPLEGEAWTVMDASRTLARQAAGLLESGEDESIAQIAARMGLSDRHLRRIFAAEYGVTPLQYLQTRRLLLAKHLLTDSALPVAEIAHAAGFASLRRFNAAFLEHYRMQPTALRRDGREGRTTETANSALKLTVREPYDVDGVLNFLLPRAVAGVEQVDVANARVQRSVSLMHAGELRRGWLSVQFLPAGRIEVSLSSSLWPAVASLLPLLRRWLDLDADPEAIAAALGEGAVPGQRLPGCVDRFELAVRAVLGQQVTVAAARTLGGRFVERFGDALEDAPSGITHTFPRPEVVAAAPVERIAELGLFRQRAGALLALAQAWPTLAFARGPSVGGIDEALAELQALPGIGPWTAHYMLMRGWSWPDAFPPGDIALKNALAKTFSGDLNPKAYLAVAEKYRPYRSYAVLHLWRSLA